MNCRDVREKLAEQPEAATRDEGVAAHLHGCEACKKVLGQLELVDQALDDLDAPQPPPEVVRRTLERVGSEHRRAWWLRPQVAGVMGLVVVCGVGLLMITTKGDQVRALFSSSTSALSGDELTELPDRFANLQTVTDSSESMTSGDAGRYSIGPPKLSGRPAIPAPGAAETGLSWESGGERRRRDELALNDETLRPMEQPPMERSIEEIEGRVAGFESRIFHSENELELLKEQVADPGPTVAAEDSGAYAHRGMLNFRGKADQNQKWKTQSPQRALNSPGKDAYGSHWDFIPSDGDDKLAGNQMMGERGELGKTGKSKELKEDDERKKDESDGFKALHGATDVDLPAGERLARQSRLVPAFKDGKQVGVKVYGVRSGSELDKLGVKNGDVITDINGVSVSTPDKALQSYANPIRNGHLDLGLERKGEKVQLRSQVSELTANTDVGDTYQYADDHSKDGIDGSELQIRSVPPFSRVSLDGQTMGPAPQGKLKLPAGVHQVRIQRDGYRDQVAQVVDVPLRFEGERANRDRWAQTRAELDAEQVPLESLRFIPADGYFANTYLPGDPSLQWLQRSLADGLYMQGQKLKLEQTARQYNQPFDAPAHDGLAVYLSADESSFDGPTRMTLQIGLKGSARLAKRRGSINAALVIDLRALPDDGARQALWTLADSMAANLQAGDRFWLLATGVDEPMLIEPGGFDATAVRRALAKALLEQERSDGADGVAEADLAAGLARAYDLLAGQNARNAPLGANQVLIASARELGSEAEQLLDLVRARALDGISTSTLGVGATADEAALSRLALAGQGRRRLVAGTASARSVMEAELAASGSVVARAVRLRIRLSAGVKLVSVLGSEPLNAKRADRVRKAEKAIDRKVARSLGIQADRGEDEQGIQIVIPAFYANDDHVVLLDVVAERPGVLADVQVRYKDLVNLRNAVARSRLSLGGGERAHDPASLNVKKNRLAQALADELRGASTALAAGDPQRCQRLLTRAAARLERLRYQVAPLADDPELVADGAMLAAYRKVLADHQAWQAVPAVRDHLVRSLALAARTKLAGWQRN